MTTVCSPIVSFEAWGVCVRKRTDSPLIGVMVCRLGVFINSYLPGDYWGVSNTDLGTDDLTPNHLFSFSNRFRIFPINHVPRTHGLVVYHGKYHPNEKVSRELTEEKTQKPELQLSA